MAFRAPRIGYVIDEFRDVFDLKPHVSDGELRPLWNFHGGDLEVPEDIFLTLENLMKEAHGTVLLLGQEDILKEVKMINIEGHTHRFVYHEVVQGLLALKLFANLEHGLLVRFEHLIHEWVLVTLWLRVHIVCNLTIVESKFESHLDSISQTGFGLNLGFKPKTPSL